MKESYSLPPGYVTTGSDEHRKYEHLSDGTTRVTVYKHNKEVRSYIEDPNKPKSWWEKLLE